MKLEVIGRNCSAKIHPILYQGLFMSVFYRFMQIMRTS